MKRGWMNRDWKKAQLSPMRHPQAMTEPADVENITNSFQGKIDIHETSTQSIAGMPEPRTVKQKKTKHREVKQETQTGMHEAFKVFLS